MPIEIVSVEQSLARIRERMKPYMQPGVSWADELIAERRAEAAREDAEEAEDAARRHRLRG